ncbi:glycoside hydrolase family 2 protein [Amycolatopsis sp. NBC_01286]|uniref:glycoside hydrolase family 2 protein n=1 Tax=Amycolatopsis sp. NBC_01286 TaxID=2903560 RepID=UPI002E12CA50|nr:glycoside hydrolase family 2 protein [Amycolatopsis sp. NBC_01286]
MRIDLGAHDWTLRACGPLTHVPIELARRLAEGIPAAVPGTVHTDLLAAGLIPDPYLDRNENDLQWIGLTGWRYETTFDRPAAPGVVELVFDGLDTVAEVELNHHVIATTVNMHRSYRVPVTDLLADGNTLAVTFSSAVRYARAERRRLGDLPNLGNDEPSNFIRKMACNFGWDWGPKLVTAGLWKTAAIDVWDVGRLRQVRPLVSVTPSGDGVVEIHADVDGSDDLVLRARVGGVEVFGPTGSALSLTVEQPRLWWPHSLGEQPLHPLTVTLETSDGSIVDTWSREIGFRTIDLDDLDGAFTFRVNGVPLFVRGANWIPDDCFPHRIDAARYDRRVQQATGARIDLLRVWGGGIYESDDFYAACDRRGVLVWQDFLFACAGYPEDEPLRGEVEAEAREAVVRLAPHPSLALWCGNNENYMGWFHWGWQTELADRDWGAGYYEHLLPDIVGELDPTRPYIPGSPWSGDPARDTQDDDHGCVHIWDVWNERDFSGYLERVPRFVSEFGWQAPPAWATLTAAVHDDPLTPESPGILHHQKAKDGNGKLARGLAHHFAAPASAEDWHYLTQVTQARAIRTGIEHFRGHRPHCMGTIVWQLNDCWPVTSWSAIDGAERRKPLWYALREAYADRLITIQERDGGPAAILVNDSAAAWEAPLELRRLTVDGEILAKTGTTVRVPPRDTVTLPFGDVGVAGDPARELLVADTGTERAIRFLAADLDIAYPEPRFDTAVTRTATGYDITVTARSLVHELAVFADRLAPDAEADQCLLTLLPGDHATIRVTTRYQLDPARLTARPVLRCLND